MMTESRKRNNCISILFPKKEHTMSKKLFLFFLLIVFLPSTLYGAESIKCASTTSTLQSGLLDYLLPIFSKDSGISVQITAVGSGEALKLGKKGVVDVVLVHAQDEEKQLVDEGYFIDREEIMYNDFIVIGPQGDPAGINEMTTVLDAFKKIRQTEATFISRGDNSGTNMRENRIWASTGEMPGRNNQWYFSQGLAMAETIQLAAEKQAYTIADRATWLSMEDSKKPGLTIVLEGDPNLFNQYGVMIVNPRNHKEVNYQSAMNFVIWLTSPSGQDAIGAFKDKTGHVLFTPNAR